MARRLRFFKEQVDKADMSLTIRSPLNAKHDLDELEVSKHIQTAQLGMCACAEHGAKPCLLDMRLAQSSQDSAQVLLAIAT